MMILETKYNPILKLFLWNINKIYWKFSLTTETESFKIQNNEIFNLIKRKAMPKYPKYEVRITNLSSRQLTNTEYQQLKFGLNHSFINKDKNAKKDITTHMESLAYTALKKVENIQLQNFNEFLRGYTGIFPKNVLNSEDFTYKNLKRLIQDQNIVILQRDKDSSVAIMDKSDYMQKLENMIEEEISKGTYERTDNTTF